VGAREEFLFNLRVYRASAQQAALLGASPPTTSQDESARLLRNGLSVIGLVLLEEYLRRRTAEIARYLGRGRLPMSAWPEKLRKLATERAPRNLASQIDALVREKEDPLPLLRATSLAWPARDQSPARVPAVGFLWSGSNVRSDDVASMLSALGVERPWDQLTDVAKRAGFTRVQSMDSLFAGVLRDRHHAAHRIEKDTLLLDIRSFPNSALAFALAFDAVACRAAALCRSQQLGQPATRAVTSADIRLRFLDDTGAGWSESVEGLAGRVATTARVTSAVAAAVRRTVPAGDVLVRRDRSLTPVWWRPGDLA